MSPPRLPMLLINVIDDCSNFNYVLKPFVNDEGVLFLSGSHEDADCIVPTAGLKAGQPPCPHSCPASDL